MRSRAGFTLIEMIVSMAVGVIVLTAAVTLVTDHSRILGRTSTRLEMHQSARLVVDMLAQDLRHAGVGVGYTPDGQFAGLMRGNFTVSGGAGFQANDRQVSLQSGAMLTDDVGIRVALGDMRTIAAYSGSRAEICAGANYDAGEIVMLTTREGMHARTVRLGGLTGSACSRGSCVGGCEAFSFVADSSYVSDPGALNADFIEGEVVGEYQQLVWFVTPAADGVLGQLQRAKISSASPCSAADSSCGGTVADGVESLQVAVHQYDEAANAWVDRTLLAAIDSRERVRVDIELVMRGRRQDDLGGVKPAQAMELANQCAPAPCGTQDRVPRWVTRSSVEIRNSGRMRIR